MNEKEFKEFAEALRLLELEHDAAMAWNIWKDLTARIKLLEADNKKIMDFADDMIGRYQHENLDLLGQLQDTEKARDHYKNVLGEISNLLLYVNLEKK